MRSLVIATEYPWPARDGITTKLCGLLDHLPGEWDLVVPEGRPGPRGEGMVTVVSPKGFNLLGAAARTLRGQLPSCRFLAPSLVIPAVDALRRKHSSYDLIHLDTVGSLHLATPLRRLFGACTPTIVGSVNDSYSLLLSSAMSGVVGRAYNRFVQGYERRHYPRCDVIDVVSPRDQEWLAQVIPSAAVRVVPLGIDTQAFSAPQQNYRTDALYLGAASGGAAIWVTHLLAEVIPRVRNVIPEFTITMAGPPPDQPVLRLLDACRGQHLGFVDDIAGLIQTANMVVVPSRQASGSPTKALQAMAAGIPVIGYSALDGIPNAVAGEHFMRVDTPREFSKAIMAVKSDADLAGRLGRSGRELVYRQHDWRNVIKVYLDALDLE